MHFSATGKNGSIPIQRTFRSTNRDTVYGGKNGRNEREEEIQIELAENVSTAVQQVVKDETHSLRAKVKQHRFLFS